MQIEIEGRIIKGNWFCEERPTNAKRIAERLIRIKLNTFVKVDTFMFVVKDIKEKKHI